MASVPSSWSLRSLLSRTDAFWLRWAPTFLGFPLGGWLAMIGVGPVTSPSTALLGGFLAGATLGVVQWLALRNRLPQIAAWIPATATGQALGLAAGAALVRYQTDLAHLAVQGAVMGVAIGLAQSLVLSRSLGGWFWWALAMPPLWACGWSVTTLAGVQVNQQFTNFGALGALVVTALSGWLLTQLLRNPASAA